MDLYWGDERFLPDGHEERNETQAREALLDHVPIDPARVHVMAPSDGKFGDDPEAAARAYAEELAAAAHPEDHGDVPAFDVCLLGRRRGRPHGVDLPGLARRVRDRARGRGGAQLPETAADPAQPDAARDPPVP